MSNTAITLTAEYNEQVVNTMLVAVQRSRTISLEGGMTEEEGAREHPWIFGETNVMLLLTRLASSFKPIPDLTILNLMNIAHKMEASIAVCSVRVGKVELPTPAQVLAAMGMPMEQAA